VALDKFHRHEALDRCSLLVDMVGMWLLDHPYVEAHDSVQALVAAAHINLSRAYQMIGRAQLPPSQGDSCSPERAEE
jgi:hypothetical protein